MEDEGFELVTSIIFDSSDGRKVLDYESPVYDVNSDSALDLSSKIIKASGDALCLDNTSWFMYKGRNGIGWSFVMLGLFKESTK